MNEQEPKIIPEWSGEEALDQERVVAFEIKVKAIFSNRNYKWLELFGFPKKKKEYFASQDAKSTFTYGLQNKEAGEYSGIHYTYFNYSEWPGIKLFDLSYIEDSSNGNELLKINITEKNSQLDRTLFFVKNDNSWELESAVLRDSTKAHEMWLRRGTAEGVERERRALTAEEYEQTLSQTEELIERIFEQRQVLEAVIAKMQEDKQTGQKVQFSGKTMDVGWQGEPDHDYKDNLEEEYALDLVLNELTKLKRQHGTEKLDLNGDYFTLLEIFTDKYLQAERAHKTKQISDWRFGFITKQYEAARNLYTSYGLSSNYEQ